MINQKNKYQPGITLRKEIVINILFWLIWAYFSLLKWTGDGIELKSVGLFLTTYFLVFSSTFYLHYLIGLPWAFRMWRAWKIIATIFVGIIYFMTSRYLLEEILMPIFAGMRNYHPNTTFGFYAIDNLYYAFQPIILSTALWLILYTIRLISKQSNLIEENKNTEIKFLRSQLNPHFIFNSLNNIYSLVYFKSEKSLPAIEELGKLMRYNTYNSDKEWMDIEEELHYIHSFISLETLRISSEDCIDLQVELNNKQIKLPTFTLITFIENAFKHGEITNTNPLVISLFTDDKSLLYKVKNKIKDGGKDQQKGIGIQNLKKRLDHYYPNQYHLIETITNGKFEATLTITFR